MVYYSWRFSLWLARHYLLQPWKVVSFTINPYAHPLNQQAPITDYFFTKRRALEVAKWYHRYGVEIYYWGKRYASKNDWPG